MRWGVLGVDNLKASRPQFPYETETIDAAGRIRHHFPRWRRILRQLVVVPFLLISTLFLGALIAIVFVIQTYISEAYEGPYKFYLYLPTVFLAVFLPYATSMLESVATAMTSYDDHRTADHHEMSLTQKIFVLNSVPNYLPLMFTAFVYVPFGDQIILTFQQLIDYVLHTAERTRIPFLVDSNRLHNETIALTLTGQISNAFEELVFPWLKERIKEWWYDHKVKETIKHSGLQYQNIIDGPSEVRFLKRTRKEALRPSYNVQEGIAEMVIQFGYLALFSPVWPLVPIEFFINSWIELRSDFLKICFEHQRPTPIRSDGIGSWVTSLEV
ncbi:hypothetical protein CC86DRAFT_22231 [Ophiobolus disseminans]|uniref:Anoctamin transmembrane domain-containing protein n=1 Tax=Ophiobolus disseminans TaxID=1469910 RepID=A0A6A7A0W6_9PLEO|nr:hypothetical protein CC86DRAFT_22231 [Ophiobolus disseminans]